MSCRVKDMGKKFVPNGVMPALVTPFSKDGDLIEDSYKKIIDYTIEKGATGVVPAGTTGEFVYMRTEERKKLLRLTVDHVDGRVPVIAGTGQNSTRATISLTKYAEDIGCDAALVISPFYLHPAWSRPRVPTKPEFLRNSYGLTNTLTKFVTWLDFWYEFC